jgi:hypothetical protein
MVMACEVLLYERVFQKNRIEHYLLVAILIISTVDYMITGVPLLVRMHAF